MVSTRRVVHRSAVRSRHSHSNGEVGCADSSRARHSIALTAHGHTAQRRVCTCAGRSGASCALFRRSQLLFELFVFGQEGLGFVL